jgi:hypothetical protein
MRIDVVVGLIFLATALDTSAARAGSDCCSTGPFPAGPLLQVICALPPAPCAISPSGYAFNPWDAAQPSYLVNQGPQLPALGAPALIHPTYAEAGYAHANAYPYVISYGSGRRFGYRAYRHAPRYR